MEAGKKEKGKKGEGGEKTRKLRGPSFQDTWIKRNSLPLRGSNTMIIFSK